MALLSIWSAVSFKSHVHPTLKRIRQIERSRTEHCLPLQPDYRCISAALTGETDGKVRHGSYIVPKADRRHVISLFQYKPSPSRKTSVIPLLEVYTTEGYEKCSSGGSHQRDTYESGQADTGGCGRQLKALDSYFTKLQYNVEEQVSSCGNDSDAKEYHLESSSQLEGQQRKVGMASDPCKRKTTLVSLENYFGELNTGMYTATS